MGNNNIIRISQNKEKRQSCIFKNRPVSVEINGMRGKFPCIALYEKDTGIPLAYPGLERWYVNLPSASIGRLESLKAYASGVCAFMNHLLWETGVDTLNEVTIGDVRNFLLGYKKKSGKPGSDEDDDRDPSGWTKGKSGVVELLTTYQKYNPDLPFSYRIDELEETAIIQDKTTGRSVVVKMPQSLWVRPPKQKIKKNRFMPEGYLRPLIYCAQKYDPMLVLAIALQAYAGLREGEVMNMTFGKFKKIAGGFGTIRDISVNLQMSAPFSAAKTNFANIKKTREQRVYPDFIPEIMRYYSEHERLLKEILGEEEFSKLTDDSPLFLNRQGRPMSAPTYYNHYKALFYDRFIPTMRRMTETDGTWPEHAAYIEAYEKEFPGGHALRHWFTMYLIKHIVPGPNEDIVDLVAKWRGDESRESMADYISVNAELIDTYQKAVFRFQKSIIEVVL